LAVALKHASTPAFKTYQQQVVANSRAVAARLQQVGSGTDTHGFLLSSVVPLSSVRLQLVAVNVQVCVRASVCVREREKRQ